MCVRSGARVDAASEGIAASHMRTGLRVEEGLSGRSQGRKQRAFSEGSEKCENGMSLPTRASEAEFTLSRWDVSASDARFPVGSALPALRSKLVHRLRSRVQARCRRCALELAHEPVRCVGVTLAQDRERICPRRPVCCRRYPLSCQEAKTSQARRQRSNAASSRPGVPFAGPLVAQQTLNDGPDRVVVSASVRQYVCRGDVAEQMLGVGRRAKSELWRSGRRSSFRSKVVLGSKAVSGLGSDEVGVTDGHSQGDEATLRWGQVATPNVPAQVVDAGRGVPACRVVDRVLPRLASTPAPCSTSPVTTRRSGAARSGPVTT